MAGLSASCRGCRETALSGPQAWRGDECARRVRAADRYHYMPFRTLGGVREHLAQGGRLRPFRLGSSTPSCRR